MEEKSCRFMYQLFIERSAIRSIDELDHYMNDHIMDKPKIGNFAILAQEAYAQGRKKRKKFLMDCAEALVCTGAGYLQKSRSTGRNSKKLFLWGGRMLPNGRVRSLIMAEEAGTETFPEMGIAKTRDGGDERSLCRIKQQEGNKNFIPPV